MANLAAITDQLKELTQCKVCFEEKVTQKQLPCQHTLCLECLNNLPVSDSKYRCPLCQKVQQTYRVVVTVILVCE